MRSILEKAIVALLNEQHDEANQLIHRFMIGRARQIHESLRQGDESVLESNWNEELSEEYFTEDDLSGLEAGAEEDEDAAEDDQFAAHDDEAAAEDEASEADSDEDAADDLSGDLGDNDDDTMGGDTEVSSDDIQELHDKLEQLMSDFETVTNGGSLDDGDDTMGGDDMNDLGGDDMGGDDMSGDDMGGDDMGGDDMGGDDMAPSSAPGMDDMSGDMDNDGDSVDDEHKEHAFGESEDDDDMNDLVESITSELEKVSVNLDVDGKEFNGKTVVQNRKSPFSGKTPDAADAEPIKIKSTYHHGYDRQGSPAVKDMSKKSRNVNAKADAGRGPVTKDGAKGALLNSDYAGSASSSKAKTDKYP